jgi:2-polyprenyl-3-methyl-5-hydroxy-6-metoxy-1,4-benzoquinol methylase
MTEPVRFPIERAAPAWLRALDGGPEPILWNLRGMRAGWEQHPRWMDFLATGSPNFAFKALETALYVDQLGGLPTPPEGRVGRALDAACGIGRFTLPLARAGWQVLGVDACEPSLEAAARHLERAAQDEPELADRVRLLWDDIDTSAALDGPFDLVIAAELLCYLPDAAATARRLASLLAPGGTLVVSVEAWPGALLADPTGVGVEGLAEAIRERLLAVPDDRWVRPIAAPELAAILEGAGMDVVSVAGTHYLPDGPLMPLLDLERLEEPTYRRRVVELERLLRADPSMAPLPRALLAVARRPE